MQFLVLGYDGTDDSALERRMAAREAHLALGDKMRLEGTLLYAAAILDDADKMVGSAMICDFPSRDALDQWLKVEPYMIGGVWKKVEVSKCKVGPSFVKTPEPSAR